MSKPRETCPAPVDAGFGPETVPQWKAIGLPFDPHDTPIRALPDQLAEITEPGVLHRLQAFDTRNNAARLYERRLDALAGKE